MPPVIERHGSGLPNRSSYDFDPHRGASSRAARRKGEISFCAYNTGIGWRNIIEHMHQNATVATGYKRRGAIKCMRAVSCWNMPAKIVE